MRYKEKGRPRRKNPSLHRALIDGLSDDIASLGLFCGSDGLDLLRTCLTLYWLLLPVLLPTELLPTASLFTGSLLAVRSTP